MLSAGALGRSSDHMSDLSFPKFLNHLSALQLDLLAEILLFGCTTHKNVLSCTDIFRKIDVEYSWRDGWLFI
jgi:hypothetical protein